MKLTEDDNEGLYPVFRCMFIVKFYIGEKMKKIILVAIAAMMAFGSAHATMKCTNTPGGFCCWDPNEDGPWPPINCQ